MDHIDRTQIITLNHFFNNVAFPLSLDLSLAKLNFEPDELIVRQLIYKSTAVAAEVPVSLISIRSLSDRADFMGAFGDNLCASTEIRTMLRKPLEPTVVVNLTHVDNGTTNRQGALCVTFEFVKYKDSGTLPPGSLVSVI